MSLLKQYLSMEEHQEVSEIVTPAPVEAIPAEAMVDEVVEPLVVVEPQIESVTVVDTSVPAVALEETTDEASAPVETEVTIEPAAEITDEVEVEVTVEVPSEIAAEVEVETEVHEDGTTQIVIEIPPLTPVTEEEVLEAEATLEELEDEFREIDADEISATQLMDDVDAEVASIEGYLEIINHGLKHKEYPSQFAAVVHVAMERYKDLFGAEVQVPSLENYTHENLEAYYTASQESFKGFIQRLVNVVPNLVKNTFQNAVSDSTLKKRAKIADAIIAQADALAVQLEGVSDKEIALGNFSKKLSQGGKAPGNVVAAIKQDLTTTTELLTQFAPAQLKYLDTVAATIGSAIYSGGKGKTGDFVTQIIKLPRPVEKLKATATEGTGLIGHVKVSVPELKLNDASVSVNAKELAKADPVQLTSVKQKTSDVGTVKLTAKEAMELVKLAKAYASVIKTANDKVTPAMKTYSTNVAKTFNFTLTGNKALAAARGASWDEDKALDYAVTADLKGAAGTVKFVDMMFRHAMKSAQTALAIAKKLK